MFAAGSGFGQFVTSNQFIVANIDAPALGLVTVLLPPGRIAFDRQLSFDEHSFFSCSIAGQIYTNNFLVALPPNAHLLNNGVTSKIADTLETVWANINEIDIIQDAYPVAFTKSGQIVFKWKFRNHGSNLTPVSVQYLLDIQLTDPTVSASPGHPNSDDGPWVLTRWDYNGNWRNFPTLNPIPWFYCAFLYRLPNAPTYTTGLSAQGYTDYPPLGLIKPEKMTIGDWTLMINYPYGSSGMPSGPIASGDCAVLLEFPTLTAMPGVTTEVARTSYGTGEFEVCDGNLFGLVFYPHHLTWKKSGGSGHYIPNPFNVEFYVFNPNQVSLAQNAYVTLRVGKGLHLYDSNAHIILPGSAQTLPLNPGLTMAPGAVGIPSLDWYVKADPATYCAGDVHDTLIFTGSSSFGNFGFRQPSPNNAECDHTLSVECTAPDLDPPIHTDKPDINEFVKNTDFHDDRPTDYGLKSLTWHPSTKKDTLNKANFVVSYSPAINPCATDKQIHTLQMQQLDSTIGGCFDFTFEDCVGNKSTETICFPAHPKITIPDILAPYYTPIFSSGSFDSSVCNSRFDSLEVSDDRAHDKGVDTIMYGNKVNMDFVVAPHKKCDPFQRFSITVRDSLLDGAICIRTFDCAGKHADTCITYCTIPDTLPPVITILKDNTVRGLWTVTVTETRPWDRLLDSIYIVTAINVAFPPDSVFPLRKSTQGKSEFSFSVTSVDSLLPSSFCVKAIDITRNMSSVVCSEQTIDTDSHCPNISVSPDPRLNPTLISASVDDIHFNDAPNNTDTNVWDSGIDIVWFSDNSGIIAPDTIHGNCAKEIPPFTLAVLDTLKVDTLSCITVNARDCHGNTCSYTWCYPYIGDTLPPLLSVRYIGKDSIDVSVSDSRLYDRGLKRINSLNEVNVSHFDSTAASAGLYIKQFGLKRPSIGQSSVASLHALDFWGASTNVIGHEALITFPEYVQDFSMRSGTLLQAEAGFTLPVYFVKNDTFAVSTKGITSFSFGFTITGDADAIIFDSISRVKTETADWDVQSVVNGYHVQITGTMRTGGNPLSANYVANHTDSLLLLCFSTTKSKYIKNTTLEIDSITFNDNRDTMYYGLNSTALMPAPFGSLSGAKIIIAGSCTPMIKSDTLLPTSVSLDPNYPNPFGKLTTLNFTVATEGLVKLYIYDILGNEVARIFDNPLKPGSYSAIFDASTAAEGAYIARLEASGIVISRKLTVKR